MITEASNTRNSSLVFHTDDGTNRTEKLRINSSGQIFKRQDPTNRTSLKTYSGEGLWIDHYQYQTGGTYRRYADIASAGDGSWGSILRFHTMPDGGSPTERLRIDQHGRLRIVNNNEDIDMDSSSTGQFQIDGNGYTGAIAMNDVGMFLYHNSSSRVLGIGVNEEEVGRFTTTGYEQRFTNTTTYSPTVGARKGIYVFNDGATDDCYASLELGATDGDDYFGSTILSSIATGVNYSNDFVIQTRSSGNYNERLRITHDGKFYLNNDSKKEIAPVYHDYVSCTGNAWTKFATIDGNQLSSEIYMTAHDTLNSVVITASFLIKVAHYQDIWIESRSMAYSELKIKVISNNNQHFDLYMQRTSGSTASNVEVSIFPQNKEGVTFSSTVNYSGQSLEHTTAAGTLKINGAGGVQSNINVEGSVTGSSKNFSIEHPLTSLASTKKLVHASIEGPQLDLIYRGKVDLVGGSATVNIDTAAGMSEGTFVLMNSNVQCFTTNETGWSAIKGSVSGNILTITAQDNSSTDTISWMVVGERQDNVIKSSNVTDDSGKLIVEPLIFEETDNSSKAEYYPTS